MTYEIAEPKKNPIGALVILYKISKGVEFDDKTWDKIHFKRCAKAAKDLLEICQTFDMSKKCLEELSKNFIEIECNWKLETVVSHAYDWMLKRSQRNDKQVRQRFLNAVAEQRSNLENKKQGTLASAGEILGSLGNLEVFRDTDGSKDGSGDSKDGGTGKGIPPAGMEEKTA